MKNFKVIPLLLAAFLVWGGAAQALTLRIGAGDPENSEMGVVGNTFKKFIEEKTNGKVKVECFYSASLGDETECRFLCFLLPARSDGFCVTGW